MKRIEVGLFSVTMSCELSSSDWIVSAGRSLSPRGLARMFLTSEYIGKHAFSGSPCTDDCCLVSRPSGIVVFTTKDDLCVIMQGNFFDKSDFFHLHIFAFFGGTIFLYGCPSVRLAWW